MWPADIQVTNVLDHAFIACDKNGTGEIFIRHMSIDPRGRRGGYNITDLTMEGVPYTPEGPVRPFPAADMFVRPASNFAIDAQRGVLTGYAVATFSACNLDVDNGGVNSWPATVWTGGPGLYPWLATPRPLQVRSTNAADTALGAGAQSVTLALLDANYELSVVTVPLNGTTPVPLGTWFRVNDVTCGSAAYRATNVGEIIVETADGPTARLDHIPPGIGRSCTGVYTVPAGWTGFITFYRTSIYRTAPAAAAAAVELFVYTPGGVVAPLFFFFDNVKCEIYTAVSPSVPPRFTEKTDIEVRATHVTNDNTQVFCLAQFMLTNNDMSQPGYGFIVSNAIETEAGDPIETEDGQTIEVES